MDGRTRIRYERTPGFLDRVGGSCVGILIGGVLLFGSTILLFWNEVGPSIYLFHPEKFLDITTQWQSAFENIMGRGLNVGNQLFLLIPHCF